MLPVNNVDPYSKHFPLENLHPENTQKCSVCMCACMSVYAHVSVLFQVITQQLLGGGIISFFSAFRADLPRRDSSEPYSNILRQQVRNMWPSPSSFILLFNPQI